MYYARGNEDIVLTDLPKHSMMRAQFSDPWRLLDNADLGLFDTGECVAEASYTEYPDLIKQSPADSTARQDCLDDFNDFTKPLKLTRI